MSTHEDTLLARAARFLIDGDEHDAANVLLSCSLEYWESGDSGWAGDERHDALHVKLTGPRAAHDVLSQERNPITEAIRRALTAVLPDRTYLKHLTVHMEHLAIDPGWRQELLEIARGRGVHNQAAQGRSLFNWKNLHFRSKSEVRIAEALDRAGVMFFPNCRGRVGSVARENREADFLVCGDGKWGILEVDGETFHPTTRTVEDHARDRLFREHGILVVEHFDANECYNQADDVVKRFLRLLSRA